MKNNEQKEKTLRRTLILAPFVVAAAIHIYGMWDNACAICRASGGQWLTCSDAAYVMFFVLFFLALPAAIVVSLIIFFTTRKRG